MVVCVRVKKTFKSIICSFASILKLLDLLFPCFLSVTRRSDIDECSSGSHDCHQNATCVNTAGHYDCICKPGLTGNGRNCSGEAIIFFHLSIDNRGSPPPPPPNSFILSRKLDDKNAGHYFFQLERLAWCPYDGKAEETFFIVAFSSEKVEGELTRSSKTHALQFYRVANSLHGEWEIPDR